MNVLQRGRRFVRGLAVLALLCLGIEQVFYLIMVPGYFLILIASPVLWGMFSTGCFFQLWRLNKRYPDKCFSSDIQEHKLPDWDCFTGAEINPTTGFFMNGGVDGGGYLYGQYPLTRAFEVRKTFTDITNGS